jgi:hypothetical protein
MDGRAITLGVVAGLAVAGLARRSAGSGNTRPGRFRKISPPPTGFTLSPLSFVRGTVLELAVDPEETGRPQPGTGLYHVTTNLPAVLADGRLRSRRELRAAGRQGAGLGGGIRDQASDRVSVGLTLDGALRVLRGTQMMARAVHGQIEAREAFTEMQLLSGGALDMLDRAVEWMVDTDDPDEDSRANKPLRAAREYEHELNQLSHDALRATPGPDLYDALRRYEQHLANTLGEWTDEGWMELDEQMCSTTVGFTEPASKFARVRPAVVGLVQLAARKGAGSEQISVECELRFRPEDLALVGVWEGR